MRTSKEGIDLIKSFEGCRLNAYADDGIPTIGYGHTHGVKMGDHITQEQAEQYLAEDLKEFEDYVNKYDTAPLTQHQFDALVSFTHNLGPTLLHHSRLLSALNEGDYAATADWFLAYDHAGGVQVGGLTRRRHAERALFLTPDPVLPETVVAENTAMTWSDKLKQWIKGSKTA